MSWTQAFYAVLMIGFALIPQLLSLMIDRWMQIPEDSEFLR